MVPVDVRTTLIQAASRIGGESARLDAELLACGALGCSRAWLFAHGDDPWPSRAQPRFEDWVRRRAAGEPVAHLLGRRAFWTLELDVDASTLIPRPDTERLVEAALARLAPDSDLSVADLGTGTGAIALALARERPKLAVVATDRSEPALALARANAARLGLGQVEFLAGDWFAPLAGRRFGLVVSNPPYIAEDDGHLQQGDVRFEPRSALVAGRDGLDDLRRIARDAPAHLQPGGWLMVEHGHDQGEAVRGLFAAAGLREVRTLRDLGDRDRVTEGRIPD
ncbi:MAG: peptide chain release factor N(5)-glutamine methyltransferase [Lysobacteraceae bacterium]